MDLQKAMMASSSGLRAQSVRMRVVAENLANASSVASDPNTDPYRRKIITFKSELDRAADVTRVIANDVVYDQSEFGKKYDPGNPAADDAGYIRTPNVNTLIEMMDIRQAQRSYESNLNALESSRKMAVKTLELLQ